MAKNKLAFESIFEGADIKPEMKNKISGILNDVVNKKVQERLEEEKEEDDEDDDEEEKKNVEEAEDEDSAEDKAEDKAEDEVEEEKSEDEEDEEEPVEEAEDKEDEDSAEDEVEESADSDEDDKEVEEAEEEDGEKEVDEESHLSPEQIKKRDQIAKAIMRGKAGLQKRYGDRAKEVAYATATNLAMQEEEEEVNEDEAAAQLDAIQKYFADPDAAKVGRAASKSLSKLAMSMKQVFRDLTGNKAASEGVKFFINAMKAVQDDPTLANRLTADLKSMAKKEAQAEMEEQFSERVDKYLTYVAEQWAEDNKLALENGIKVQIAEDFLSKMNSLYTSFNFKNVPEVDMVVEMTNKIVAAETALNEQIEKNATLLEQFNKQKKETLINETAKGLTATQQEKFKKLVESVTFENEKSFEKKLTTIKETAFTKEVLPGDTKLEESEEVRVPSNDRISKYVDAISKNLKF
jgi:hypothetical protein